MKRIKKSFILLVLSVFMLSGMLPAQIINTQAETNENTDLSIYADNISNGYTKHKKNIKQIYDGQEIRFSSKDLINKESIDIDYEDTVSLNIEAPQTGHYYIKMDYKIKEAAVLSTALEMQVNGEFPYDELRSVEFSNLWSRNKTPILDRYGNEIVPEIDRIDLWQEKFIIDESGRESHPLLVPLNEGNNEITLTSIEGNISIQSLSLHGADNFPNNKIPTDPDMDLSGDVIGIIEAETPDYQNSSSVRPGSWFNKDLSPYDSLKKRLNYLDGLSFKNANQFVGYEFEVEEEGYYYLGFRYLQDTRADFNVTTDISVNGIIPSQAYENFSFDYETNFSDTFVKNDSGAVPVYLNKGLNTIEIKITADSQREALETTENIIYEIQQLSLTIKNLVGNTVDKNRDFDLEEYLPDIPKNLIAWADQLEELFKDAQESMGTTKQIGIYSEIKIAEQQLREIASDKREIHFKVDELATGQNSITSYLGSFIQNMNNNGLSIDKIYFSQNTDLIPEKPNFIEKSMDAVVRFFNTFTSDDYSTNNVNPENLQVWVNRPRQYIEILQNMIDSDFTEKTGVKVDLSIMPDPNKLILANASGNAPDVALGVNYALPFDLAIRGALLDLSAFDDFEDVASKYSQNLHTPAIIGEEIYAMPETMNFYVMFYRKDILDSIGVELPNTMDDVVEQLPILHQKGLNFFYPTAGMAGMKIFAGTMPIIYQNGGSFYEGEITKTSLNSNKTIDSFKKLTDLFTIYNMPYDVPSFYQQFRNGSLPIGISDYGAYNLLLNAAPEISNMWDITLMPGYTNEEGKVERWSSGGAESSVIFSDTDKPDDSWEFMKWWSSTETQTQFGRTLQTSFGEEYIWNTANLEAFENLPWLARHKDVIVEQSQWIQEVPRVLGTYMVEREISNAYNSVVLDGEDLRRTIDLATKRINRETLRKLEEFGYYEDGLPIIPYPVPGALDWRSNR